MSILQIFLQAVRDTWSQKKMIALVWSVTLLFSLPAFWAAHKGLGGYFGTTLVPEEWLKQFNINYLLEMISEQPAFVQSVTSSFFATAFLYLLISVLITGGVVGQLLAPNSEKFMLNFFANGGKYFGRFLRLFLWTLLLCACSCVFLLIPFLGMVLLTAAIGVARSASDVAKIRLATEASYGVSKVYFSSLLWVFKNFLRVAALYLLGLVMLLAGFAVYKILDPAPDSHIKILWMFLIQQIFVFFRTSIKIQMLASAKLLWQNAPEGTTMTAKLTDMPLEAGAAG